MPESSGTGDPARTLQLLWREPNRVAQRGPKQGLTVDRVVRTAIELADAEGLAAVTMRRVAEALGVAPMTLYTYVPGKAELLDLMLDTVYAEMSRANLARKSWRRRVQTVAMENRDLFNRHPWAAAVSTSRPPLGPGLIGKYEYELGAFAGLGLTDVEMDAALTFVLDFVQAAARATAEAQTVQRTTDLTDEQWWAAHAPLLGGSSTRPATRLPPAWAPPPAPRTVGRTTRLTPSSSASRGRSMASACSSTAGTLLHELPIEEVLRCDVHPRQGGEARVGRTPATAPRRDRRSRSEEPGGVEINEA